MTSLVASFSKCHAKTFEKLELAFKLGKALGEKMFFFSKIERDYLEIRSLRTWVKDRARKIEE